MSLKSLTAYNEIRNRVEQAEVAGGDETGENINGALYWIWAWVTHDLTYIFSDKSRGKVAIDKHFKNGLPHTIFSYRPPCIIL